MKSVFIVLKNADFTEGRGPMLFHSVWEDGEQAIKYVEKQQGISGSRQKVERGKYGHFAYANGYLINEKPLMTSLGDVEAAELLTKREAALRKLNDEDKRVLGLTS
jgi:hypothetical protein